MSDRLFLIELAVLYLPMVAAFFLWRYCRPLVPVGGALLLSFLWNGVFVFVLNQVALQCGWWAYAPECLAYHGLPLSVWCGWAVSWGIVVPLLPIRSGSVLLLGVLVVDLLWMPLLEPLLLLQKHWVRGELLSLLVVLLPGLLLFRWTLRRRVLLGRVMMQGLVFFAIVGFFLPDLILTLAQGRQWAWLELSGWGRICQGHVLFFCLVLGITAVREFMRQGKGTPIPYDAPTQMVRSGLYAYVANPMQLSTLGGLLAYAWMLESWGMVAAALMGVVYSLGVAWFSESDDLERRFGQRWRDYRQQVRYFLPRWRPYVERERAVIYFARDCSLCSALGAWLQSRQPLGLEFRDAEDYGGRPLQRLTYVDGAERYEGVVAWARGLSHVHLAWAIVACFVQFPGIAQLLQCMVDADMFGKTKKLEQAMSSQ